MLHQIILWFHTEYLPYHQPFYDGGVWSNIFVVPIAFLLGWLWSKTKFWPIRPLEHAVKHLHTKVDDLHKRHDTAEANHAKMMESLESLHSKHDKILAHLDRRGIVLPEAEDHVGLEELPLPSESQTDQAQPDHQ